MHRVKIEISFAPSQDELAVKLAHELKAAYPSLTVKKKPAAATTAGITYGHIYLNDGRKW